jgi:hypothetical protein
MRRCGPRELGTRRGPGGRPLQIHLSTTPHRKSACVLQTCFRYLGWKLDITADFPGSSQLSPFNCFLPVSMSITNLKKKAPSTDSNVGEATHVRPGVVHGTRQVNSSRDGRELRSRWFVQLVVRIPGALGSPPSGAAAQQAAVRC